MYRLLTIASLIGFLSIGLSCSPSSPPGPQGPQYPDGSLDLSDTNNQTLAEIGERFVALAGNGGSSHAAALVAELQASRNGVTSAALGSDGYTIFVKMSDGSPALINTNAAAFRTNGGSQVASLPLSAKANPSANRMMITQATTYTIPASFTCPGQIMPTTRRALIMNTAAISHPSTNGYVTEIQNALIAEGWQAADIDTRSRQGDDDHSFTPLTMLNATGYGLVFVIAQGSRVDPGDGVQHAYLQCCRAGNITDVMQPEQWLAMIGERNDGRLIRCQTATESGGFVNEVYARDDLLTEQMSLDNGTLVYFISPNSRTVSDGMSNRGAGSSLGWEGSFSGRDGLLAVLGMMRRMTAANTWTTDVQAFESLVASGQGASYNSDGVGAFARLADITGDFYLPAWARFSVDSAQFPSTATQVKVDVSYSACPSSSLDFTMGVAEAPDAGLLPAGEATVTVEAVDAAGKTVGSGLQKVPVNGGLNEILLTTCTGTAKIQLAEHPTEGANATAKIRTEFIYPYEMDDAPQPVELNLANVASWSQEIPAGKIQVRATAMNAAGQVVGEQIRDAEIECDISPIGVCFGWVKLQATKTAANVVSIRVTSNSSNAPGPYTFTRGSSVNVYGLKVGEAISFNAEALDPNGNIISSKAQTVTVACGENTVDFDLINYAVLIAAQPNTIAADGLETSLITATLRYWKSSDTTTPTGDPVSGKSVEFGTTFGVLNGVNPVITNAAGQATILLSGTQSGVATVTAYVREDQKQNSIGVTIGNTDTTDLTLQLRFNPLSPPNTEALLEAVVQNKDGTPAVGIPVRFQLTGGAMDLVGSLNGVTGGSGVAFINLHSNTPTFGLIEATIPGTTLSKRYLACLGLTVEVVPSVTALELDKDEVMLTATVNPDPGSLGFPLRCDWSLSRGQGRSIRGGTATAWARYNFTEFQNTAQAKITGGAEPDTSDVIKADLTYQVDGEWQSSVSWTGFRTPATVSFYGAGQTVAIRYESSQKEYADANPKIYTASVRAYFPLETAEGRVRYIVNNSKDDGTTPPPAGWMDGTNNTTSGCPTGCSLTVAADGYTGEQPPGAWIAQKQQEYQQTYGHLTITVYGP